MDAKRYTSMISDHNLVDLKKMQYKYSPGEVSELLELMKTTMFQRLSVHDFEGSPLVFVNNAAGIHLDAVRLLIVPSSSGPYGTQAMENEIFSTLSIENIESSHDSIRRMMNGYEPSDSKERRIYGIKKALDFIADPGNEITQENIHRLYQLAIGEYLDEKDRLLPDHLYRHDKVYVVGSDYLQKGIMEHEGLSYQKLPEYMAQFVAFIHEKKEMNDLLKAAVIHFYLAYLHPYFDGNGRMARFMHIWFLIRQGYPGVLFISLSSYIKDSRKAYHDAFRLVEKNAEISRVIDVTPFLLYFTQNVYNKMNVPVSSKEITAVFQTALSEGRITSKEAELWNFILSAYCDGEFSTKQIEKDFGNAAYATIHSFVLKFKALDLLCSQRYGNRVKYRVKTK
jgi:hypothetical protein